MECKAMKHVRLIAIVAVGLLLTIAAVPTLAHEQRTIGNYVVELGWRVEPTYTNLLNGPVVFVNEAATGEATPEATATEGEEGEAAVGAPVTGLEATLQLEVSFGGKSKKLALYAVEGEPGE